MSLLSGAGNTLPLAASGLMNLDFRNATAFPRPAIANAVQRIAEPASK